MWSSDVLGVGKPLEAQEFWSKTTGIIGSQQDTERGENCGPIVRPTYEGRAEHVLHKGNSPPRVLKGAGLSCAISFSFQCH